MGKVVIKILHGSAVTQTLYILRLQISYSAYMSKLWKLVGSRQSYCRNKQAYFFGPPCIAVLCVSCVFVGLDKRQRLVERWQSCLIDNKSRWRERAVSGECFRLCQYTYSKPRRATATNLAPFGDSVYCCITWHTRLQQEAHLAIAEIDVL